MTATVARDGFARIAYRSCRAITPA
jgi:hypothetical protein